MTSDFYSMLEKTSLEGQLIDFQSGIDILSSPDIDRLSLLQAAYGVRYQTFGNRVKIHVLNNAQNGNCPEDCSYCAQAKTSKADIPDYTIKSDDEILQEARNAYEAGAFRYCMVFSGRGPTPYKVKRFSEIISKIKETYPIEVCLSAGLLDQEATDQLKQAGLDRLNHNLNTGEEHYKTICSTHTYQDRLDTLESARQSGLELCSGLIIGMGESHEDIVRLAFKFRELQVASIPVNFYIPIPGNTFGKHTALTPDFCLRVLSLFRFVNPKAEIRAAAGREIHLRGLQSLLFYPANSLFMDGYLNTTGTSPKETFQLIQDAGFEIESDHSLDELITSDSSEKELAVDLKTISQLKPALSD